MSELKIYLLGSPRLELGEEPVKLNRSKAVALLVYLAITGQSYKRESLATLFWPEYDRKRAYANLRRTLWEVNQVLGQEWLEVDREAVALRPEATVWVDADQFHNLLEQCDGHEHAPEEICDNCLKPLEQAVELYHGDFLSGFSLPDSPEFDEWQFFQADGLRREMAGVLERLAICYLEQGDFDRAIANARHLLAMDPLQENVHRLLMLIYAQAGQRNAALRQYQESARILAEELDVQPEAETQSLFERIQRGEIAVRGEPAKPLDARLQRSSAADQPAPVYLPAQPTAFIGREVELQDISALLCNPDCRLLTLLGPGGIGKTRLAIQAASAIAEQATGLFPHGIYFLSLAPLTAPESILQVIADTLKFTYHSEDVTGLARESAAEQLLGYLRSRRLLLLLDNFEHLIDGAQFLDEILNAAPEVKIFVTSRERLNLRAEWAYEVPGLSYPSDDSDTPLESYSAVQLFLQTARRSQAGFSIPQDCDAYVIGRICQMVSGLPLGVELAASWVKVLPCDEIAAEIERNIDFLTSTQRDIPQRHYSLRAVFDHSWNLLSKREQDIFQKLAVFQGRFTRQAAVEVTGASLPVLAALVDKSLLRRNQDGQFELHQLLKQYALDILQQDNQTYQMTRDQHCAYYADFLDKLKMDLKGSKQLEALATIEAERANIRQAWRWAISKQDVNAIRKSLFSLVLFINARGAYQEGEEIFRPAVEVFRALAAEETAGQGARLVFVSLLAAWTGYLGFNIDSAQVRLYIHETLSWLKRMRPDERAQILISMGFIPDEIDGDQVVQYYEDSLTIFSQQNDQWAVALVHLLYGDWLESRDLRRANEEYQKSLAIFRSLGGHWGVAAGLHSLSENLYSLGEYIEAERLILECREVSQQLGDQWREIDCYLKLGRITTSLGQYVEAKEYYQTSLERSREMGNSGYVAVNLACVGNAHYLLGEFEEAKLVFQESLEICQAIGDEHEMGMAYGNLGNVTRAFGDMDLASEYYLESVRLLEKTHEPWGLCVNLNRLASLCVERGDLSAAWQYYQQALELASQMDLLAEALEAVIGAAEVLVHHRQPVRAIELLAFGLLHSATAMQAKETGIKLLGELEDQVSPEAFKAACQRGRAFKLHEVVTSVLGETQEGL